jgi:site-specific recombinase XerD
MHILSGRIRHTYGHDQVARGVSLYQVQELLGHSTPAMTQRYAHLSPEHLAHDPGLHLSYAADAAALVASKS